MKKIFISGSCVSRDILEFLKYSDYELVAYHARSSLAVLATKIVDGSTYYQAISNIPSVFQRRMVEYDFKHMLLKSLALHSFDVLLMDLIDERFHVAMLDQNSAITRSTEFLRTELKPRRLINSNSDEFFNLWCNGVKIFFNILNELNIKDRVLIQKAYWSNMLDNGTKIDKFSDEIIQRENDKLNKMYKHLELYLDEHQFIEIPKDYVIIKSEHKWGISPFHYIDAYYEFLAGQF